MPAVPVNLTVELPGELEDVRSLILDELRLAGVEARSEGRQIVVERQTEDWEPGEHGRIELRLERAGQGTSVTVELRRDSDLLPAWFVSQALGSLLRAASSEAYGDWLTDRRARRPSGADAREIYGDPLYHWPNFRAILAELELTADDFLLEVGCGGGAFLHEALKSGCRAAAIDHSADMVRLASEQNADAIAEGRLEIVEGDAAALPFADGTFSAAVMTGVLGFLPDPVAAFAEIRRVLARGGRVVALAADPALKGTPAAPEPMASRLRFYTDEEHEQIGREGGLDGVRIKRIDLGQYARESGIPEEALPLFEGVGTPFLVARRD